MKLTNFTKKGEFYKFELEGTPAIANAIRRSVVNEVPSMAIDLIEFQKNSSTLYDEIIAHRLGMVVLKTDLVSYNLRSNCNCDSEGCAKCQVNLVLNVKGPATVYAKDLESQDPKIIPAHPETVVVQLLKGQEIQLIATARLGTGKEHAKWSSGLCYYSYKPTVTVNNSAKQFEKMKGEYPPQVFDKNGKISKDKILDGYVDACEGICEDIVKIEFDDEKFEFTYEPWGQLDGKKTIQKVCEIMTSKSKEFVDQLKAL